MRANFAALFKNVDVVGRNGRLAARFLVGGGELRQAQSAR